MAGRTGLRTKWTLAILGVALVPMIVLGLFVLDIQRRGLSTAEKELEAAVVDEAATDVTRALDQASDVGAQATKIFDDDTLSTTMRERLLLELTGRAAPAIEGIAFFTVDRAFVDAVVPKGNATASLKEPPTLTAPGFRVAAGGVLRYEAPLTGMVRGFIVVSISRAAIETRLRELSSDRFKAPDRVYLVDESLHVIAGGGAKTSVAAVGPIFTAAGWSTANSFTSPMVITTEFEDDGIAKVGTIRPMPHQRWALVVERPTSEAFAALTSARQAFLGILAAFALGAALVGLGIVHRVIGPINALMKLVQRYARREFDAKSDVTTGDELEALGSSLETMAHDLSKSEDEIKRRARIEVNLRRYMPAEAADAAAKDESSLALGGAKKRVTVVFADVVAFTSFAEKASPEDAVAFLNELFTILSEIVFRHGGMVDKFIGDCIMAIFHDDVTRALEAAEDMHAFVESNLPRWREAYSFNVELGIGIATGDVLIGNLGSSSRMEYTVIGDAVNVAARLESLAGPKQTLTTQEVVEACPAAMKSAFTPLGEHALRGKAKPVTVFEVMSS